MLFVPTKCIEKLDQIPILDSHKILKETGSMTFGFDANYNLKGNLMKFGKNFNEE